MAEPSASFTVECFTARDGYRWHYRRYLPAAKSVSLRARLVCIHGIQSHAGWYEYSCGQLSQAGYEVFFVDRRGSGANTQARGDAPGFRRLVDDLAEFLQRLRASKEDRPTGLPVYLLAISWGGKLAVALQRRHPGLVDGLVLLCPGFFSLVRPSFRERLAIAWARLIAPRRLYAIPLNDPALFTANLQWQRFLREDPLSLRQATARLLVSSVFLDRYVRSAASAVRVPVLLLLAGQDRIIDNARTRQFVEQFASRDREVQEYPQAHHTLEFEAECDSIIQDIRDWLDRHCAPPARFP